MNTREYFDKDYSSGDDTKLPTTQTDSNRDILKIESLEPNEKLLKNTQGTPRPSTTDAPNGESEHESGKPRRVVFRAIITND